MSRDVSHDVSHDALHLSHDGILPIHKIRIEQMVIINEKTEIASAFLDCRRVNSYKIYTRSGSKCFLQESYRDA